MSRSGYSDDCLYSWEAICYRGAVASALRGKRGQSFLREMAAALDAMPVKRLIAHEMVNPTGEVCAMGAVCVARKLDVSLAEPEEAEVAAQAMDVPVSLVREIAYENDERGRSWECENDETPERRWKRMRAWVASKIRADVTPSAEPATETRRIPGEGG